MSNIKNIKQEENKEKISLKKRLTKFYNGFLKNMSSIRQILIWYVLISIIGAILLWAPISHAGTFNATNGKFGVSFLDSLFVSSSAFSDTGLSTLNIGSTFNWFGELVTLILLNIGGIGWFTVKIFIITFIFRKKLNYSTLSNASSEVGTISKNETMGLIFSAVFVSIASTFIFGFIFSLIFYFGTPVNIFGDLSLNSNISNYGIALWTGIYHASASINNSGLDIFAGNVSMQDWSGGVAGIFAQIFTMFLFILGGIGFGVVYDVYQWAVHKKTGKIFEFSLVTKISVVAYAAIAFTGLALVQISESINVAIDPSHSFYKGALPSGANPSIGYRFWALTFNTFSTRNAGFSTMDMSWTNNSTKFIQAIMMFIGSGPGSTAGGLRTTTFFVILASTWANLRNKKTINAFKRTIPNNIVKKAYLVLIISLMIITFGIVTMSISESSNLSNSKYSIIDVVYVIFSAFGTTGLSTIPLDEITIYSKLLLIVIMFSGQLGMVGLTSQLKSKNIKQQKMYAEEYVNLG